ncbi:MAG: magnesium transporter CorA family protein [Bacteroidetes bacterium]|nr:magnesium transporter CorA family protein [Bacteroidota bacterium]
MVQIYKIIEGKLTTIPALEPGCWVNIYPPTSHEAIRALSNELQIDIDYFTDALDIDEQSRYDTDDDTEFILLKTPIRNENLIDSKAIFITIPISIVRKRDIIITTSLYKNPVIDSFLNPNIKQFDLKDHTKFILNIFEKNVYYYLYYLKQINIQINAFEKEMLHASRNKDFADLLNIQKSLIYFVTNLRANDLMIMKMKRMDYLKIKNDEHKEEMLEEIMIDNSQAVEMSDVYTRILNSTMEAVSSIISNNVNTVMKRLTGVTIVLMVPNLISSFFGMNVHMPFAESHWGFLIICNISLMFSMIITYFLIKNKWM